MHKSIGYFGIIILLLTACAPTTVSPTTMPPTTVSLNATDAPALKPVTPNPTQERVFTNDTEDAIITKDLPTGSEAESDERQDNARSHADIVMGEAVFIYERAGGLKGIGPSIITWTMYSDGRVISSDGRSWQLPPNNITALVDSIMALGFADFEASYIPEDTCCDRATHTITIRQGDAVYKVSILDDADAPDELYQMLDLIGEFLITLPT